MKSIFFPFEQMINFIDYQRVRHPLNVILLMMIVFGLFCLSNLWLALVFLTLLIVYIIYSLVKRKNKPRKKSGGLLFGFVVCIFLATVYDFTTKYYNEDLDIRYYWSWWPFRESKTIHIYSGEKDGNYYKLMEKITKYDPSNFEQGKIGSSGGYENPNRVMLDQQGLSFVKEDIYNDGDRIKEQVSYVTPLYMEKLHIVYNKTSPVFKILLASDSTSYLSLGNNDDLLREAIRHSRIAVGITGSSTKILSDAVLSEISTKKPSLDVFDIENAPLDTALAGIRENKFDIIFFIAGQPVDKIKRLLMNKDSFGLIGIEPSLIDAINKSKNTKYRNTDFSVNKNSTNSVKSGYSLEYESMPTLGSYCYLIVNKKVKSYQVKNFINILTKVKDSLNIDFLNFNDNYDNEYEKNKNKTLASLLLSLTGGVALGTIILSFIFALVSSFFHDKLSNKLASVIKNIPDDRIPDSNEFEEKKIEDRNNYLKSLTGLSDEEKVDKIKMFELYYEDITRKFLIHSPYIKFYQIELINEKIISGMSQIVDLRQHINTALDNGKLNTDHFNDLLVRTDAIMDKLRKSLFLRLHELFNRIPDFGGINKNDEQIRKLLLKCVTSSYLNFDDYKRLIN